ncbi:GNAT family N-acetyltransferase [Tersicoccus sp. Bi-70]|uniref:GNAT family N-acetyltransferase n=1 Tax=Tersicoccus sp. Bi-70 TaxID=1897634 RepID=UPI0009766FE6|nr:GNAT family N-acetyltransferase [Tersicoccus sp. Bi-70]OMH35065.1 GNAT family N-acetyltransferase [Tersicoccus sp. Bi-70]
MDADIIVKNNPDRGRYELLDEGAVVGRASWVSFDGPGGSERIFFHTTVDEDHAGQGLASTLVRQAVADTARAGIGIVAVCPYVTSWLSKHSEQPGVVAARPEHRAAVPSAEPTA